MSIVYYTHIGISFAFTETIVPEFPSKDERAKKAEHRSATSFSVFGFSRNPCLHDAGHYSVTALCTETERFQGFSTPFWGLHLKWQPPLL
jgi:hypothetical protein